VIRQGLRRAAVAAEQRDRHHAPLPRGPEPLEDARRLPGGGEGVGDVPFTARIQEVHALAGHILCERVEAILYPDSVRTDR